MEEQVDHMIDYVDDIKCCLACPQDYEILLACFKHMHVDHGFYIPDFEHVTDMRGLFRYLEHKVKQEHLCLYCKTHFHTVGGVQAHMVAKMHCKLHFSEQEQRELQQFFAFFSCYCYDGKADILSENVKLGGLGGCELVITDIEKSSIKILGSRKNVREYRKSRRRPRTTMTSGDASRQVDPLEKEKRKMKMKKTQGTSRKALLKMNWIRSLPKH